MLIREAATPRASAPVNARERRGRWAPEAMIKECEEEKMKGETGVEGMSGRLTRDFCTVESREIVGELAEVRIFFAPIRHGLGSICPLSLLPSSFFLTHITIDFIQGSP